MLDFAFILDSVPVFAKALKLTLYISVFGIGISLIIGFICAWILFLRPKILTQLVTIYVECARNTPLLIQLFFLYYGLHSLIGYNLNEYLCAIIGLAFLGGGYMCESFRASFEALPNSQRESAQSLGLSQAQSMIYVLLPQSLGIALPQIGANVIFLLKETSVVSVIALADVMFVAKDIITTYSKTNEALAMLALSYLVVLLPLSILFSILERFYKKRLL